MVDDTTPEPHDDCCPLGALMAGKRLQERSRRQLDTAKEHVTHNDGVDVWLRVEPGASGKFEVMHVGLPSVKSLILGSMKDIFPPQRDGRTAGRK